MTTFDQFPKKRPALAPEIERVYKAQYRSNRRGETLASFASQSVEAWMHRMVAKDLLIRNGPLDTLEIGAGTLNQLAYENPTGAYDIVEPFKELYADSPKLTHVRSVYDDVSTVPTQAQYDRITSIAVFEHLCDLPEQVAWCAGHLRQGGTLRVAIPSEGTFLWWLGWRGTTGLEFWLRYGLDYGHLIRHEHVNTAIEIRRVLEHFFTEVVVSVYGVSPAISLYQFYECSKPRSNREC